MKGELSEHRGGTCESGAAEKRACGARGGEYPHVPELAGGQELYSVGQTVRPVRPAGLLRGLPAWQGGGTMTHLSLFSGIGGLDLAAEAAGFITVGQCEWADYPTEVLEKHWPDVPRWRDIRTLTKESFYERTGFGETDIISGGFPCQPFSVAGKRRGREDDRYIWPEMFRVIEAFRPTWVVGENVAGISSMALDTVLADLENIGYAAGAFIIPACAVDAPHRRDRCAIVAYADGGGTMRRKRTLCTVEGPGSSGENYGGGTKEYGGEGGRTTKPRLDRMVDGFSHWLDEPVNIPRIANGVKDCANRVKGLGNAVVPQQFFPIFKAIWEIEAGGCT